MWCRYKYDLPGVGKCCHKYYETKREDGKIWTHFPLCKKENCPIVHPELMSAAKKKDSAVCIWCGYKLENDNESFCSAYCADMWNGGWD